MRMRCQIVRSPRPRRSRLCSARNGQVTNAHAAAMPRPAKRNARPIGRAPGTRARKPADLGASSAGSTVSEPMIAVRTTRIVASAMPEKTLLPARNMPLMAAMTVRPETSTARPEVAAAISIASTRPVPFARSWRSRAM